MFLQQFNSNDNRFEVNRGITKKVIIKGFMSEERIIRINKVLRELNISLERAVDYLKDKGIAIESNQTQKFLMMYTMSCAVNLQVTEGKKKLLRKRKKEKRKRLYV
jgi:hypothetical protein